MLSVIRENLKYLIPSIKNILFAIPLYSIWFLSYLELSPKLGNIWYRIASDGEKHINLGGLREFIYKPFKNSFFWWPRFWDINIYIGIYITAILINLLHKAYTIKE
tara:strand:+ start:169 stop:486 length:318 start_codon:yes stop_codon:yes gene_type:complete